MKLLFDQNISFKLVKRLLDVYPDSTHVRLHNLSKSNDLIIWEFAKKNELIILTHDSDFYDIAILKGVPPKIIWIRSGNCSTNYIEKLIRHNSIAINHFIKEKKLICLELF